MVEFVKFFPYEKARDVQTEVLRTLEKEWDNYDCFVLVLPTASGKSSLAKSIMGGVPSASLIVPTNLLVNQFLQEFPTTRTLHRLDSYTCAEWKRPCSVTRAKLAGFCKGCACSKDLQQAKYRNGPGIYNYYTYLAHKTYRDVLIIDEAHLILPVIKEKLSVKVWQHDYKYPSNMYSPEQTLAWIATLPPKKQKDKKVMKLKESCLYKVPEYISQRTEDWFNGKGTVRGEPEERDLIKLTPVDVTQAPPMFWPQEVRKIVLMSGTISAKDIEHLGLSRKRILYVEGKSPIPVANRPIIFEPITSVSRNNMEQATVDLVKYIKEIAEAYPNQKGLVHASYQLARMLEGHLGGGRFMFHSKENKKDIYRKFRDSPAHTGNILIASGLYEGVDLPEDAGRFQIIAKVPWQSLASPAIKHIADLDPEAFAWETIKTLVQAGGRICRGPEDVGDTYIPDSTFWRLLRESKHLFPKYFLEALHIVGDN
jgi:ATP-dependent DNA helicase DinG